MSLNPEHKKFPPIDVPTASSLTPEEYREIFDNSVKVLIGNGNNPPAYKSTLIKNVAEYNAEKDRIDLSVKHFQGAILHAERTNLNMRVHKGKKSHARARAKPSALLARLLGIPHITSNLQAPVVMENPPVTEDGVKIPE